MSSQSGDIEILTSDDVLKVAQRFMKNNSVDVQNYKLKSYSEQKLGHMGSHLLLTLTIKKTCTDEPAETYNFFVKAILQDSQEAVDFAKEHDIFTGEFDFFNKIKPLLLENYKDEAWSPICYLAEKDYFVMEDLRIKGFKLITAELLDKTSLLKSALATIARFHACSIIAEAQLSKLHKEPIFLNKYFPNSMKEKFLVENKTSNSVVDNTINLVFALAKSLGRNSEKIGKIYQKLYEAVKPSEKYRNVICHGDLWANNLMFNDTEPQSHCVLVDFQTLRYAPSVLDILQFIYLNTTSDYRKQHEQELIKFYFMVLEKTIRNNDKTKTSISPKFEEILEAYEYFRFFGASLASFYLPFILLDQEKMKEIYAGPNGFSNALLSDRTLATFKYMEQNISYKIRIEEVVHELADIAEHQ